MFFGAVRGKTYLTTKLKPLLKVKELLHAMVCWYPIEILPPAAYSSYSKEYISKDMCFTNNNLINKYKNLLK